MKSGLDCLYSTAEGCLYSYYDGVFGSVNKCVCVLYITCVKTSSIMSQCHVGHRLLNPAVHCLAWYVSVLLCVV